MYTPRLKVHNKDNSKKAKSPKKTTGGEVPKK